MELKKGIYKHYKGNRYEVLEIATHSETLEKLVVYKALYGNFGIWVRPYRMFIEQVEINNIKTSRFKWIGETGE
ncbi:MAG: DUF1653 domain-containing protein [Bacteroidetes bacterium]|nr:DUF1653 domain-containing protein [Bacteroidota bacterium]